MIRYICMCIILEKKIYSAQKLKRFIDTTIYNSHSETLRKIATELAYNSQAIQAVQMFEAILREGDDRGLQMEWLGLQKLQPQLSDLRCIVLMSIGPVTKTQS